MRCGVDSEHVERVFFDFTAFTEFFIILVRRVRGNVHERDTVQHVDMVGVSMSAQPRDEITALAREIHGNFRVEQGVFVLSFA